MLRSCLATSIGKRLIHNPPMATYLPVCLSVCRLSVAKLTITATIYVSTRSEFGIPLGVQLQSIRQAAERFGDRVCGLLLTRPTYQVPMLVSYL